jgi:Methyltransferase domain
MCRARALRLPERLSATNGAVRGVADFLPFVLCHLPPPPARVLEVGCGDEGGLVPDLAGRGYEVVGVDPRAPDGVRYLRSEFQETAVTLAAEPWDAIVAARVLHHVDPLDDGVALLVRLAPLLLVDEFAPDLIRGDAQAWYEERRSAVGDVQAPVSIDDWRRRHPHLHPHDVVLGALRRYYEERELVWVPYLHRWLRSLTVEAEERAAIAAGDIPAVGWRWAGGRTGTPPGYPHHAPACL